MNAGTIGCLSLILFSWSGTLSSKKTITDVNAELFQKIRQVSSDELIKATKSGDLAQVNDSLSHGADVNARFDQGGNYGSNWTALMQAAIDGKTDIALALIKAGANVNLANSNGSTALSMAANLGHLAIVQALIAAHANVNSRDIYSATPLKRARDKAIRKVLKDAGAVE